MNDSKDSDFYKKLSNDPLYRLKTIYFEIVDATDSDIQNKKFDELITFYLAEFPKEKNPNKQQHRLWCSISSDFWTNTNISNSLRIIQINISKTQSWATFSFEYMDIILKI